MARSATVGYADELIRFARAWAPFGGPGDEVFVTFGVGQAEFYQRVMSALATNSGGLSVCEAADLQRHCRRQLALLRAGARPSR